jgi:hypothetical protein
VVARDCEEKGRGSEYKWEMGFFRGVM